MKSRGLFCLEVKSCILKRPYIDKHKAIMPINFMEFSL
jgi:hypothetical protein